MPEFTYYAPIAKSGKVKFFRSQDHRDALLLARQLGLDFSPAVEACFENFDRDFTTCTVIRLGVIQISDRKRFCASIISLLDHLRKVANAQFASQFIASSLAMKLHLVESKGEFVQVLDDYLAHATPETTHQRLVVLTRRSSGLLQPTSPQPIVNASDTRFSRIINRLNQVREGLIGLLSRDD